MLSVTGAQSCNIQLSDYNVAKVACEKEASSLRQRKNFQRWISANPAWVKI
jgi:hypothetical protein